MKKLNIRTKRRFNMGTFLKAEWRRLIMANYDVDPEVLKPWLPKHTELDIWEGRCYVSLVGFLFVNTRLKGLKIPFHVNFEEMNLRFYVRYNDNGEWKRGVVFIKEIVPKRALSLVANILYGEPYETMPMSHAVNTTDETIAVGYGWKKNGRWNTFEVTAEKEPVDMEESSEAEFITEHFWGYTKRKRGYTSEYGVEHPRWQLYPMLSYRIDVDFRATYGEHFAFLQELEPVSVFLTEGSEIVVKGGRQLR